MSLRRKQILDTTLEIIAERGISGVNMAEISKRVGIVPSALYRHFDNKETIFDALIDSVRIKLFEKVRDFEKEMSKTGVDLKDLFLWHIDFLEKSPGIPKLIFSDASILGSQERRVKIYSIIKKHMEKLVEIIELGKKEGLFNNISSEAVAFSIISLVQHVALMSNLSNGKMDTSNFATQAWEYIEESIYKKER